MPKTGGDPTEQAGVSIEPDGGWLLDVQGVVENAKFKELRQSHGAGAQERDEVKRLAEGQRLADEKAALTSGHTTS